MEARLAGWRAALVSAEREARPQPGNASSRGSRTQRLLWAAIAVCVVLLAALLIWKAVGGGSRSGSEAAGLIDASAPQIVSPAQLSEFAAAAGQPVYWAGERPGTRLELRESGERVYLRYLTAGAAAGDPRPDFLTVATYPLPQALAALRANAKRSGAKLRRVRGGALAWVDPESPTSVYLAWPGAARQVEVYDPSAKRALAIALSGAVEAMR